jgi:hypothetical protein
VFFHAGLLPRVPAEDLLGEGEMREIRSSIVFVVRMLSLGFVFADIG